MTEKHILKKYLDNRYQREYLLDDIQEAMDFLDISDSNGNYIYSENVVFFTDGMSKSDLEKINDYIEKHNFQKNILPKPIPNRSIAFFCNFMFYLFHITKRS
jgi:hydroxymethylpyrimidine pyrophosphatase-like HAD family hydrolase